jgi:hypothetical protein
LKLPNTYKLPANYHNILKDTSEENYEKLGGHIWKTEQNHKMHCDRGNHKSIRV